ncbi:hypothetical protein HMPREF1862_00669 [Varibaculum cambriense]|uniref:Uncharacterized protein n=1 Tax=Varibaculum cambriense TaxID=184870 RepID=A0AB34WZI4_9ACTO|nr:hypothetical protein HMPREF1862_00669 [Varibaculum cambriense]
MVVVLTPNPFPRAKTREIEIFKNKKLTSYSFVVFLSSTA